VYTLLQRAGTDLSASHEIVVAARSLDALWVQFETDDTAVLDGLIATSSESDYSTDLPAEILCLVNAAKSIARKY